MSRKARVEGWREAQDRESGPAELMPEQLVERGGVTEDTFPFSSSKLGVTNAQPQNISLSGGGGFLDWSGQNPD